MSAHVTVKDQTLTEVTDQLRSIERALCETFGIEHATIQPESSTCVVAGTYCVIDERHEMHAPEPAQTPGM
jgi:hypothetical protein